jgi:hypothetical protein
MDHIADIILTQGYCFSIIMKATENNLALPALDNWNYK